MASIDQKYETLIELAPDPIFLVDTGTREVIEVNKQAVEKLGYERAHLVGMDVLALHPSEQSDAYLELFERTRSEGTVRSRTLPDGSQLYLVTNSGERIPVELHARTIVVDGDPWAYSIARDITEHRRFEEQLEKQRDLLAVLNEVMRHDLRNDLQVVEGYTEVLADHVDDEATEELATIRECAANAVEFTTTAGDLAEVIRNPDEDLSRVSLTEILDEQRAEIQHLHQRATVQFADSPPDVDVLATDMLGSAFRNLFQNAIQHNDTETPEVTVSVEQDGETVQVHVADNGPGISDDQKNEIFGRGETGLDSDGSGLGLYLVQTLVERCNGSIDVTDNDPRGTVFTVELPTAD